MSLRNHLINQYLKQNQLRKADDWSQEEFEKEYYSYQDRMRELVEAELRDGTVRYIVRHKLSQFLWSVAFLAIAIYLGNSLYQAHVISVDANSQACIDAAQTYDEDVRQQGVFINKALINSDSQKGIKACGNATNFTVKAG